MRLSWRENKNQGVVIKMIGPDKGLQKGRKNGGDGVDEGTKGN